MARGLGMESPSRIPQRSQPPLKSPNPNHPPGVFAEAEALTAAEGLTEAPAKAPVLARRNDRRTNHPPPPKANQNGL